MRGNPNYMFRLDKERRKTWDKAAAKAGYPNLASYIKAITDASAELVLCKNGINVHALSEVLADRATRAPADEEKA